MILQLLRANAAETIDKITKHGVFPKENSLYDYKVNLNMYGTTPMNTTDAVEIFMKNFAKDVLSFVNSDGGVILIGIYEDKSTGTYVDNGLDELNVKTLNLIDLNLVTQKFESIAKTGVGIDLQSFQIGTRKFFYLLIEKQDQVLVPMNDFADYRIKKGEIFYRASGKNETANNTTQEFNRFLQIKANEKNRDFLDIWSRLLPEMFDINPKEILIINPIHNKVYGLNRADNTLSSADIEIESGDKGVINVILNAISAGEIGKITDTEGKPLYKIVGEIQSNSSRRSIPMATLEAEVKGKADFKFTNVQLKSAIYHLGWVNDEKLKIDNPPSESVIESYAKFVWIEKTDEVKDTHKIVFSKEAVDPLVEVINDAAKHMQIFKKQLDIKP